MGDFEFPRQTDGEFLAARFAFHRPHLRAVAHRMPGSSAGAADAADAVQEAWFRLSRTDAFLAG